MNRHFRRRSGLVFVELVVVVAIVVALAAIVVPMVHTVRRDEVVADVLDVVSALRTACYKYSGDTGQLAVEVSSATEAVNHRLSMPQPGVSGWRGPYLDHPLAPEDSPFGGLVVLCDGLGAAGGFDVAGNGQVLVAGAGNCVRFTNCRREIAEMVDQALDVGTPGPWERTGRVKWAENNLAVFLYELPGR